MLGVESLEVLLSRIPQRRYFYEAAVNKILDDLVEACQPRKMEVIGEFSVRGGMRSAVRAEYQKEQP
ncbi:MAG: hypothetical protein ACE5IR_28970 [bacterium]